MIELTPQNRANLRNQIADYFTEDELKTICEDLGTPYDNLPGEAKTGKIRELLGKLQRDDRLEDLLVVLKRDRPNAKWLTGTVALPHQEQPYENHLPAFLDAEKIINDYFEWCLKTGIDTPTVNIKIIAVAMTFSWPFIIDTVPRALKKYPKTRVHIEAMFVDHKFLEDLPLANYDVVWADVSQFRTNEVKKFAVAATKQFGDRLALDVRSYKNLPHWHGLLINEEHLFLGRTNWSFPDGKPELRVGQNKYRYFNKSDPTGGERVDLFANWHKYYFDFVSTLICSTPALDIDIAAVEAG
jgi:hypothetical protein